MHVLIDHLAALLISSTVLLIFVIIQMRGTQATTEATIHHIVYSIPPQSSHHYSRFNYSRRETANNP